MFRCSKKPFSLFLKQSYSFHNLSNSFYKSSVLSFNYKIQKKLFCSSSSSKTNSLDNKDIPLSKPLLSINDEKIIREEQGFLKDFLHFADKIHAPSKDIEILKTSLSRLDKLFSIVVVGEFNSGKSSFLNALLGNNYLDQGITPTTQKINVIKYAESIYKETENSEIDCVYVPVSWLKEINVVDTPGTNAIIRTHEAITEHFIPQSDLILFITSVERPFSESERLFLEKIQSWSKKVVVVITKIDILSNETELLQVKEFVTKHFSELTKTNPLIFPVSARITLNNKLKKETKLTNIPNTKNLFNNLEEYIHKTLDTKERLQLKLTSPLGICSKLVKSYENILTQQEVLIKDDKELLNDINNDIDIFFNDMKRDFKYQESRVDNVLLHLKQRGELYLDNALRLSNVAVLLRSDKITSDFELNVVKDAITQIDSLISDIIDWIVEKNTKEWSRVIQSLKAREKLAGVDSAQFQVTRKQLLSSIGEKITSIVHSYDKTQESIELSNKIQKSMFQAVAVAGASAVGMGALLSLSLLDFTGILGISALAATGLCIIPYRRLTVKKEFNKKIQDFRGNIISALNSHFEDEVYNSCSKIRDSISPFSTFVQKEELKHSEFILQLQELRSQITKIQSKIDELTLKK